jgi:hypothetical protein
VVENSTNDPKFKGSNPAAASKGKKLQKDKKNVCVMPCFEYIFDRFSMKQNIIE